MAATRRFVSGSIEQILVAMANGLLDAQEALNELPPTDAFGRPQGGYHLPYLDFEVKVTAESGGEAPPAMLLSSLPDHALAPRVPDLRFKPITPAMAEMPSATALASTLSGRFVSVPPNDGLPPLRLDATSNRRGREITLSVAVDNAAGEHVSGARVEFNIDHALTRALTSGFDRKRPGTRLTHGVVYSEDDGVAENVLTLATDERAGTSLAVVINVGATFTHLIVTV